jgi:GNAT superfamily N-acetyltransferase
MLVQPIVHIRQSTLQEDPVIAKHFYQMWRDLDVPVGAIEPDWLNISLQYMQQARRDLQYQAFVAEADGQIVGSASCQIFAGLYPLILKPEQRHYGYIWGVYVEPAYRKQGIATQLTQGTIDYLRSCGCTRAILNASPVGKPVYDRLGFTTSNAMHLDL